MLNRIAQRHHSRSCSGCSDFCFRALASRVMCRVLQNTACYSCLLLLQPLSMQCLIHVSTAPFSLQPPPPPCPSVSPSLSLSLCVSLPPFSLSLLASLSFPSSLPAPSDAHMLHAASLDTLYQRIRQLAPNARVYVASYPDLIPDSDCEAESDLSSSDIQGLKSLVGPLDQAIQAAVARAGAGFTFVDMRPVWAGHMVCSDDAWANGVEVSDPSQSYHPNMEGQMAYQRAVFQAISAPAPAPARSS